MLKTIGAPNQARKRADTATPIPAARRVYRRASRRPWASPTATARPTTSGPSTCFAQAARTAAVADEARAHVVGGAPSRDTSGMQARRPSASAGASGSMVDTQYQVPGYRVMTRQAATAHESPRTRRSPPGPLARHTNAIIGANRNSTWSAEAVMMAGVGVRNTVAGR